MQIASRCCDYFLCCFRGHSLQEEPETKALIGSDDLENAPAGAYETFQESTLNISKSNFSTEQVSDASASRKEERHVRLFNYSREILCFSSKKNRVEDYLVKNVHERTVRDFTASKISSDHLWLDLGALPSQVLILPEDIHFEHGSEMFTYIKARQSEEDFSLFPHYLLQPGHSFQFAQEYSGSLDEFLDGTLTKSATNRASQVFPIRALSSFLHFCLRDHSSYEKITLLEPSFLYNNLSMKNDIAKKAGLIFQPSKEAKILYLTNAKLVELTYEVDKKAPSYRQSVPTDKVATFNLLCDASYTLSNMFESIDALYYNQLVFWFNIPKIARYNETKQKVATLSYFTSAGRIQLHSYEETGGKKNIKTPMIG